MQEGSAISHPLMMFFNLKGDISRSSRISGKHLLPEQFTHL